MKNVFNNIYKKFLSVKSMDSRSYVYDLDSPMWTDKSYRQLTSESFHKNVVAHRCISLISKAAASIDWLLYGSDGSVIEQHPLINLLHRPNPTQGGAEFFESLYAYKMISGNAYVVALRDKSDKIKEIYLLRPDRVEIVPGKKSIPSAYVYKVDGKDITYKVDSINSTSEILHIKSFNPLDDWYGLSQIEVAAYSIDLHNQSAVWNQSLLQNGARPSGAMVVKASNNSSGHLTDEQFQRLQSELMDKFTGSKNAGKPLLLEGGLEWQEMGYSPKDMDFIEAKNSAARDIALAFGVPAQMLGIKGDNTYNNMQEARLAFWEETILPLVDKVSDALNNWLAPYLGYGIKLGYNRNSISALSMKQEKLWNMLQAADFITTNEKRAMVGLAPLNEINTDKNISHKKI